MGDNSSAWKTTPHRCATMHPMAVFYSRGALGMVYVPCPGSRVLVIADRVTGKGSSRNLSLIPTYVPLARLFTDVWCQPYLSLASQPC